MTAYETAISLQDQKFAEFGFTKTIVNAEHVCTYTRNLGAASDKNPVLVLLHGYPQSSYLWRHFIELLPSETSLFIPDLPGYGASAPIENNDKLSIGKAVLSALQTQFQRSCARPSSQDIPVILIGHDRGARVAHRLCVSGFSGVQIKGVCLIDIVPTLTQWHSAASSRAVTGFFHWPFLANVPQANAMISAYGGDRWCSDLLHRWVGSRASSLTNLASDSSFDVYTGFFLNPSVVDASNKDYEAGATVDVDEQESDQEEGRKLGCDVLVLYSEEYLGKRFDIKGVWEEWMGQRGRLECVGIGDGVGHFVVEEHPQVCAKAVVGWLHGLGRHG
ncbi:alpha/beta-hydrolase [Sporormia fimetaria CBS 119925]|uniref:Alpha/beta-hydrolase n=1 Tax=Sporormia fimetaria CBS 119925 TaxID=1340428 RepID=A0A6A6VB76_9PLEO|nr:alpha/beta-hydrolase [Sporormia fimetaria CBS 119925]